ncbi:hypothetical protein J2Z47_003456 [Cohnella thailandensis]|uniref:Uncharacterized protein n=1 Tax=Cohnella thailandensis TaxID=557557 RepID=A0A841SKQ7_9BACL|nr:hypothetical protein [Cohnella thailandensis]MBP1975212.1 hypothetical protein [Cohnella thailandensis]
MKETAYEYVDFRYYTPSEFEKLGGLWPIRSGTNVAKANYAVGTRMIECYSIHVILNGSVDYTFEDGKARLRKGDLFCLYPAGSTAIRRPITRITRRFACIGWRWTDRRSCRSSRESG